MMEHISIDKLGKAYKKYPGKWSRLKEWLSISRKQYHKSIWVLNDISFSVNKGDAMGIIGSNGAGKSTLLKLITGTSQPSAGKCEVAGSVAAILELGMGFHPDFTGRQNAFMAGQLLGISYLEMVSIISEIESFAEINDYFDMPVRIYSSGMSVRLAFAVATAIRPDILIVDEALSVGDAYFQQKSFTRIREFQSAGTTLLLVSHDIAAVLSICNKAVWLHKGELRLIGETKTVVDAYSASLYENHQETKPVQNLVSIKQPSHQSLITTWKRDTRQDFINSSSLRNDIQVFDFDDANADSWGDGDATIVNVTLTDLNNTPFSWMTGGESVILRIKAQALCRITNIILGFIIRDRLGQSLFGDNTYLTTIDNPVCATDGQYIIGTFNFQMPILPSGAYSVTAAIATGTQEKHKINDWRNQAVMIQSYNRNAVLGLIGIPMHNVSLTLE